MCDLISGVIVVTLRCRRTAERGTNANVAGAPN